MSEYLFTNLPRYVKTTPRENFSNSVVKSGSVLLFSEDGENLVAKLPDGSFTEIGGGSGEYYKCASVDTSAKTWTGYKAVLNGGVYTFENTVTQGLVYTSITPVIGNIYSANALAKIAMLYEGLPTDGLVFYAPLRENKTTAETGQVLSYENYQSAEIIDGVPCLSFNETKITSESDDFALGTTGAASVWFYWNGNIDVHEYAPTIFQIGQYQTGGAQAGRCLQLTINDGITVGNWGTNWIYSLPLSQNKWHHAAVNFQGRNLTVFLDGELIYDSLFPNYASFNVTQNFLTVGFFRDRNFDAGFVYGYISSIRFYNRNLEESEILALYNEFEVIEA